MNIAFVAIGILAALLAVYALRGVSSDELFVSGEWHDEGGSDEQA